MGWKTWYQKARTKGTYSEGAEELVKIVDRHVGLRFVENILDVGCGDCRLQPYFKGKEYYGLDKEYNEFELLSEEWVDVPKNFDLGITSLVLMLFNEADGKYIFKEMEKRCKYIVLYEENYKECEMVNPNNPEKYYHDYSKWGNVVCWGKSSVNENWAWYVFKGRVK